MAESPSSTGVTQQLLAKLSVLLIEDERTYFRRLKGELEPLGFEVTWEWRPSRAVEAARALEPDAILLDLILPDLRARSILGGEQVAVDLRRALPFTPILILTGAPDDQVTWDLLYPAKPANFIKKSSSPARIAFLIRLAYEEAEKLRRAAGHQSLRVGALEIDLDAALVTQSDQEIHLTGTQHRLFDLLVRDLGRWLKYDTIIDRLWNDDGDADYTRESAIRNIHTLINQIRRKIETGDAALRYIENRPGWGYRMRDPGPIPEPEDDDELGPDLAPDAETML